MPSPIGIPARGLPSRGWPAGSIPETGPVFATSSWDVMFVLFASDHGERWPVFPIDATIGHDQTLVGSATLTFPGGDDAPELFMGSTAGAEFPEVKVRAYCRGDLIWTGESVVVRFASSGPNGVVELQFEHCYGGFLRRRQIFQSLLAAVNLTDQADDAILIVQKNQIGTSPVIPTGHPGTRTDFGSNTVTVDTGSSLAPSIPLVEQSGQNLLDVTKETIEANDLAPVLQDNEAGSFVLGMTYPFEDEDLTDQVIFCQYHGNLANFELTNDRTGILNIWGVEGKTANSASWDSDGPSIALWGEVEGFAQKPQDTNSDTAKAYVAAALTDRHAPVKLTYKAEIIETEGHQFVTDFFWRDRIRIVDAYWGFDITGAVTFWSMHVSNGRMHTLDIGLGEPREGDIVREVVGMAGRERAPMGKWRNRRQS